MSQHINELQNELELDLSDKQKKQDEINRFASNIDMNNDQFVNYQS